MEKFGPYYFKPTNQDFTVSKVSRLTNERACLKILGTSINILGTSINILGTSINILGTSVVFGNREPCLWHP